MKKQLKNVPKEALIDGLLDLQRKLEKVKVGKEGGDWDRTEDWVGGHK